MVVGLILFKNHLFTILQKELVLTTCKMPLLQIIQWILSHGNFKIKLEILNKKIEIQILIQTNSHSKTKE